MDRNLSLLVDLYELTMAQSYFIYKKNIRATFDLFVRELPRNRSYLVSCGLEDILNYVRDLKFSAIDLEYLKSQKLFSDDFLKYLRSFRFKGQIWAMPEGTIFFANEPVIRVTASIIEAQIIESFLLNTINLQAMIASKASRVVSQAKGRSLFDFSLRRTHGTDAAIKAARSSYIAGFNGTSNVYAGKIYKIPVAGTMAHSFVMSFKREWDSFLAYSKTFPDRAVLLVDTYDVKKGIKNAVSIGLFLKEKKHYLQGIRLDSGDIVKLSKYARKALDDAGLKYAKIFASGNLDEFKIRDLLRKGVCADSFGVGTNMGTSIDAPCLDVIYKISEVSDEDGNFLPTMKLSKNKVTYPGRKQVFRIRDKKGRFIKDMLCLEEERFKGEPLLIKVVDKGQIIYQAPSLDKLRVFLEKNISKFNASLQDVYAKYRYPVIISPRLETLRRNLIKQLKIRQ